MPDDFLLLLRVIRGEFDLGGSMDLSWTASIGALEHCLEASKAIRVVISAHASLGCYDGSSYFFHFPHSTTLILCPRRPCKV